MGYQQVGGCRFYIDILSWLKAHGLISYHAHDFGTTSPAMDFIGINPSSIGQFWGGNGNNDYILYNTTYPLKDLMPVNKNFTMYLGHKFKSAQATAWISAGAPPHNPVTNNELINITNADSITFNYTNYDGFSICIGNDANDIHSNILEFRFDYYGDGSFYNNLAGTGSSLLELGSFLYGTYYDMPHSPDLSLTLEYDYSGVDTIETMGGSTLSNARWTSPAKWGYLAPWQLSLGNDADLQPLSRSGRKIWSLSFSFIADSDLFSATENLNLSTGQTPIMDTVDSGYNVNEHYQTGGAYFNTDEQFLASDNFYSQVIHKTNGGQLPFIFQPDSNNSNADGFCIAKLDSGFQFKQVANGVYSFKCKIREVW